MITSLSEERTVGFSRALVWYLYHPCRLVTGDGGGRFSTEFQKEGAANTTLRCR